MSFAKLGEAFRRRVILDALNSDPGYSLNEAVLRAILKDFGFAASHDLLRTELAWLVEQGLLTTSDQGGIIVAKISARGVDVATGCVNVPGVARPEPEAI